MSLKKKKDEAYVKYKGRHMTAKQYFAEKRKDNRERLQKAKAKDPFKEHFKYDQAIIKQYNYKREQEKKMQAQDHPNRKITEFMKKKPTKK